MAVLKNRAKMSTSTTGTGTITLGSAESGYQSFADAGVANADVVRYVIEDGSNFEIGTGTYTSSGTTLSRTVSESSNSDAAINLSGSATVFIGATAADIELSGNMAGDISSNGHEIKLGDRSSSGVNELVFGDGDDLRIFHGTNNHSQIVEGGSGNLQIYASNLQLKSNAGGDYLLATDNGSVELFHASSKKLETTSSGLQTTGTLNVNGAYTLPTSDGTNGQVLTTDGSGAVTFADAGGGGGSPDLFAESYDGSSTKPSASGSQNAVSIGVSANASGHDTISIGENSTSSSTKSVALGYSAYAGGGGQNTAIGPNSFTGTSAYSSAFGHNAYSTGQDGVAIGQARSTGTDSLAAAISTNSSSYGASSANSIAMGRLSKTSGADGISIGDNNIVSNSNGIALGSSHSVSGVSAYAIGHNHTVSGYGAASIGGSTSTANQTYAMTFGPYAKAAVQNAFIFGSKGWFSAGSAQGGMYILYADTTDATATVLTTTNSTAGSTNQIVAANDTCITFDGTITAMQNGAQAYASWKIEGLLVNDGGTTTLANSATTVIQNSSNWGMALSADNTNNALAITFTGEAGHNIRVVANIRTTECTYA